MNINITGRHLEVTDALRGRIQDKMLKVTKYYNNIIDANVILSVTKYNHVVEIILQVNGVTIRGIGETEDMYSSLDMALVKVEGQLKRYKEKFDTLKVRQGVRNKANSHIPVREEGVTPEDAGEEQFFIEATEQMADKPMTADEAALQLNQSERSFLAFTNSQTEQVNVIYRRRDGKLALIAPEG